MGLETSLAVEFRIEARVGIGVDDVEGLAGGKSRASQSAIARQPDFLCFGPLGYARPELAGLRIVNEQGAAFGGSQLGRRLHDFFQQRIEVEIAGNGAAHLQQDNFVAMRGLQLLDKPGVLERGGGLGRDRVEQSGVGVVKAAIGLIQDLGDADYRPVAVADRDAKNVARPVAGLLVRLRTEPGIPISVGNN